MKWREWDDQEIVIERLRCWKLIMNSFAIVRDWSVFSDSQTVVGVAVLRVATNISMLDYVSRTFRFLLRSFNVLTFLDRTLYIVVIGLFWIWIWKWVSSISIPVFRTWILYWRRNSTRFEYWNETNKTVFCLRFYFVCLSPTLAVSTTRQCQND